VQATLPIVGIHGAPRSGTSWFGQLFNSHPAVAYRYQPFFSHAFRNRINDASRAEAIRRVFGELLTTSDAFVNQTGSSRLARDLPDFEKTPPTHLVYKEVRFHHLVEHLINSVSEMKCIGIVRDPRAVLASWFQAPKEFREEWTPEEEWRHASRKNCGSAENWYGFERWKELSCLFLDLSHRYPDRFRLVRYEELVEAPERTVTAVFEFCGLACTKQTARFIEESTTRDDGDPYGVFRRLGPKPPAQLPDGISELIEQELSGGKLSRFLC
jgi:hypothetical protein